MGAINQGRLPWSRCLCDGSSQHQQSSRRDWACDSSQGRLNEPEALDPCLAVLSTISRLGRHPHNMHEPFVLG